jgi:hypothetical protein
MSKNIKPIEIEIFRFINLNINGVKYHKPKILMLIFNFD